MRPQETARPLVSVIIPWVFAAGEGGEHEIESLVSSVLEKTTYGRYEVVIPTGGAPAISPISSKSPIVGACGS